MRGECGEREGRGGEHMSVLMVDCERSLSNLPFFPFTNSGHQLISIPSLHPPPLEVMGKGGERREAYISFNGELKKRSHSNLPFLPFTNSTSLPLPPPPPPSPVPRLATCPPTSISADTRVSVLIFPTFLERGFDSTSHGIYFSRQRLTSINPAQRISGSRVLS